MIMDLKLGDIIEFKNYEDIDDDDRFCLDEWDFPRIATVAEINTNSFRIEETFFDYSYGSVKRVLPKDTDTNLSDVHEGDEVLIKATVMKNILGKYIVSEELNKENLVKINVHHKFIVQDDHYGMYVSSPSTITTDKKRAHIFNSHKEANETAADMHLNAWDVIKYDA